MYNLWYYNRFVGEPIYTGTAQFDKPWYDDWLDAMVKSDNDVIFFLTVYSTDVGDVF